MRVKSEILSISVRTLELEDGGRYRAADERTHDIVPDLRKRLVPNEPCKSWTDANGRIEGRSRDASHCHGAGQDGEPDRQSVVRIARRLARGRGLQHDETEREGENEFGNENGEH